MAKTIPIYILIQAMTATEKSYFKKYAFKKDIKTNTDFKRLFDIIFSPPQKWQ